MKQYHSEHRAEGIQNFFDDLKYFQKEESKKLLEIEKIINIRKMKRRLKNV